MRKLSSKDGFTLMEVLIAMIILSMSLLLLLNMSMVALEGNDWSNKATASTQLMQAKLEELRTSKNFSNGSDTVNGIARNWTGSHISNFLERIDITASWLSTTGDTLQSTMTAYIKTDSV